MTKATQPVPVRDYFADPETFSPALRVMFLYRLSQNGGDVKDALDDVSISPVVALRAYKADASFKAAWDEVMEAATLVLEHTALRRANYTKRKTLNDVGQEIEVEDKPSDKMLVTMLKARKPDVYTDRVAVTGKDGGPLEVRDALVEQILGMLTDKGAKNADPKGGGA